MAASLAIAGCGSAPSDDPVGGAPSSSGARPGASPPPGSAASSAPPGAPPTAVGAYPVGIAGFGDPTDRPGAIRRAIELSGGMPWLKPGDTVLIKVAHNGINPYPFTASAIACVEIARMCLEAGAKRVSVADVMGIDMTLVPGGWAIEDPFGGSFDAQTDATVRAFTQSGLRAALDAAFGASNVGGKDRSVHVTSFREDGLTPVETESLTVDGKPRLCSDWIRSQLKDGETWTGGAPAFPFTPRAFDASHDSRPGLYVPNLAMDVDHIVDLYRVSTHVMSHYSLSLKNWIGTMRPDDRIWMHQLGYLKNRRGTGNDPIRTEPPYNEILPELHLPTRKRERLYVADASQIIASGGPDAADRGTYPANVAVASTDPISADVIGLSLIRLAVLASILEGGLGARCMPPPQSMTTLALADVIGRVIPWRGPMTGNDLKLCDATFSPWDWIAIQRARESKLGALGPKDLDLRFADAKYALPAMRQAFLTKDANLAPVY